jgi:hypothetical protein
MAAKPKIIASAIPGDVVEYDGKTLIYRPLSLQESMRLMRLLGNEGTSNDRYFGMATLVCGIRELDGVPLVLPKNVNECEGRAGLVGQDAVQAVANFLRPDEDDEMTPRTDQQVAEEIKNS